MSEISTQNLSISNLGADAGIASLNTADIPANVRDGDSAAREAYVEGLSFEDVLVKQFTSQMVSASSSSDGLTGSDDSTGGSGGGSSSSSSGLFGAADNAFSSMIPQTLADSIMSNGGLGIADSIAESIDPAMAEPKSSRASFGSSTADSGGTVTTDSKAVKS